MTLICSRPANTEKQWVDQGSRVGKGVKDEAKVSGGVKGNKSYINYVTGFWIQLQAVRRPAADFQRANVYSQVCVHFRKIQEETNPRK